MEIKRKIEYHGDSKTRLYRIWSGIKTRCYTQSQGSYKYYGEKGINMDDTWKNSYIEFKNWALNIGYSDNLEIDRIDNKNGYFPHNCRWVSKLANTRNREYNKLNMEIARKMRFEFNEGESNKSKIGRKYNTSQSQVSMVINNKIWKE